MFFCRSNIKFELEILLYIPRKRVKYLARARASTLQNEGQKFRNFAHFPAKYIRFQILLEHPIFVVQKLLIYEKASIFDRKYDEIKIKQFI